GKYLVLSVRPVDVPTGHALVGTLRRHPQPTVVAVVAADVVEPDHAVSHSTTNHARTYGHDHASRLVPRNDGAPVTPLRRGLLHVVEVGAADSRHPHLDDDFAGTRLRVGEVHELDLAVTGEHDRFHGHSSSFTGWDLRRETWTWRP